MKGDDLVGPFLHRTISQRVVTDAIATSPVWTSAVPHGKTHWLSCAGIWSESLFVMCGAATCDCVGPISVGIGQYWYPLSRACHIGRSDRSIRIRSCRSCRRRPW